MLQGFGRIAEVGIPECLSRGGHAKMGEPIVGLGVFGIDKMIGGGKHGLRYFAGNLTGHVLGVKALDLVNGGLAVDAGLKKVVGTNPTPANHAQTRHYDSLAVVQGFGLCR